MSGSISNSTELTPVQQELYEFIAGELVARATPGTQEALMLLAVAGVSEVSSARAVLGTST